MDNVALVLICCMANFFNLWDTCLGVVLAAFTSVIVVHFMVVVNIMAVVYFMAVVNIMAVVHDRAMVYNGVGLQFVAQFDFMTAPVSTKKVEEGFCISNHQYQCQEKQETLQCITQS